MLKGWFGLFMVSQLVLVSLPGAAVFRAPEAPYRPPIEDSRVDYLILTAGEMKHEFARLARLRERSGLRARIVTLAEIYAAYPSGVDDAERIRFFLQAAHRDWGVRFLLLGGDATVIPIRRATLRTAAGPVLLPTDQYYACLEGTWNADGDSDWGESPGPEGPGDDVDLTPELYVGRAPVRNREQARNFVHRTQQAESKHARATGGTALLAAEEFEFGHDGAQGAEVIRQILEADPSRHVARLYERYDLWPGSFPESRSALLDSLNSGYDLGLLIGAGGPGTFVAGSPASDIISAADFAALRNRPRYTHVYLQSSFGTDPDVASIGAAILNARHGGAVTVLGATKFQFVTSGQRFAEAFFRAAFEQGVSEVGAALATAIGATVDLSDNGRLTTQGTMLFGDPALDLDALRRRGKDGRSVFEPNVSNERVNERSTGPKLFSAQPNPATTAAHLEFHLDADQEGKPFSVTVHDLQGRKLRVLDRGVARAGRFQTIWDLRASGGERVAPGLYFARLSVGGVGASLRIVVGR